MVQLADRTKVLIEVRQRVLSQYGLGKKSYESALFDTIYDEMHRLEENDGDRSSFAYYKRLHHATLKESVDGHKRLLRELVEVFVDEVIGEFDDRVYALTAKVAPPALGLLLNSMSPLRILDSIGGSKSITDQLMISGDVEGLRRVTQKGTVVLVPTHISNLDSIMIGYGLHSLNLPPYTYGAGLNLFSNKLLGFFMRNLGAYKVDRKKTAELYKKVLKTYAGFTMEMGYHNLFFPGGTRSRSGMVETKLKKGLLGMALNAYIHNLKKGKNRDIFVVPCTLNYQLVLEAETLIDDFLKDTGKNRFIIEDDEFSQPKRILDFVTGLFSLHSRIHMVLGAPMDVFGNLINKKGESLDGRGRVIDRKKYVMQGDEVVFDPRRDAEYVRELSMEITDSYAKNTVINSTNLVSFVVFQMMVNENPGLDLYRLLRTGGISGELDLREVYVSLERVLVRLRRLAAAGKLALDDNLYVKDPIFIMSEALSHLKIFHQRPALSRQGDRLVPGNRRLLYYYQNRLAGLPTFLEDLK